MRKDNENVKIVYVNFDGGWKWEGVTGNLNNVKCSSHAEEISIDNNNNYFFFKISGTKFM